MYSINREGVNVDLWSPGHQRISCKYYWKLLHTSSGDLSSEPNVFVDIKVPRRRFRDRLLKICFRGTEEKGRASDDTFVRRVCSRNFIRAPPITRKCRRVRRYVAKIMNGNRNRLKQNTKNHVTVYRIDLKKKKKNTSRQIE